MQCFAIATSAQSGVPLGAIIAGSDTQGTYYTANDATSWAIRNNGMYPPGHGKLHQIAAIMWSAHETGPTGISAIYALTGDAGSGGVTNGGGLAVSLDGAQTWTCRSTAVMGGGNHAGTDVIPSSNWPRPAGRLLAEDSSFLYAATYGGGVKRSADHGNTWPVTFKMGGTAPATGAFICYGMFLDSSGTLWLVTYPSTTSNGGLWKCTTPQATAPSFTPVSLPSGIAGPTTIDVLVLDTGVNATVYLACGTHGVWSNPGGTWGNLNGNGTGASGGLDTSNGSYWNTLDGYVDGSGNHIVVAACSNPPAASVNNIECAAQIKVTAHGSGTATWTSLANKSTVTVDPIPGHGAGGTPGFDPFTSTVGTELGSAGFVNPQIRVDPTDSTHQTLWCCGSNGMYLSTNGGGAWQMVNNGVAAFLGHACAADPNHAGYMVFGDSDWHGWQVSDGVGIGGATADAQATIQRVDPGNQSFCFAYDPVDSTVYVGTGPKYGSPNSGGNVKSKAYNAWSWGPSILPATPPFTKIPMGMVAFRNAANQKCLLVAVAGDDMYLYNGSTNAWTDVLPNFGGTGLPPSLFMPMVYAGGGVVYAWNRAALYCSTSYGAAGSWSQIWGKASATADSQIAVNPNKPGELWVSAASGLYKLTGANTSGGSVVGATVNENLPTTTQSTHALAATYFDNCFAAGTTFAYNAQKVYYQGNGNGSHTNPGDYPVVTPTSFVDGSNQDMTAIVNGGAQIWLCYQPNGNTSTTEDNNFKASVQSWVNSHPHGANGVRVIIYQEPQNAGATGWGFASNGSDYATLMQHYVPLIQAITDPAGRHVKVVYDAAGHSLTTAANGGNACTWLTAILDTGVTPDECVIDFYGSTWENLTSGGTTNLQPVEPLRSLAMANNMPFGYGEIGRAEGSNPYTPSLFGQYIAYIQSSVLQCPTNRRTGVLWYDGDKGSPNQNTVQPGSDMITALQAMYNALTASTVENGGITLSGPFTGSGNEVANNSAIGFDTTGNLYCAVNDGGSGTGVYKCAGNATTSPDGNTWADVVGDQSFAQCNGNPENMAIGPDNRIYISGSNAVATGLSASSGGITEVQAGNNISTTGGGSLVLYFNQTGGTASLAGSTLIARIEVNASLSETITGPAGWVLDADSGTAGGAGSTGIARVQIWRLANAAAGAVGTTTGTAATFTQTSGTAIMRGVLAEYGPPAGQVISLDQTATAGATSAATSMPVTAAAANKFAGELGVAMFGAAFSATPSEHWNTPTTPGTWTVDGTLNNQLSIWSAYSLTGLPGGTAAITGSVSSSTSMTGWAGALATYYSTAPAALKITTTTVPGGAVGTAYAPTTIAATGGVQSYTWSATGLPPGLALGGATGTTVTVTGTPTAAGTFPAAVTVTDGVGNTATKTLTFTIAGSGPGQPPSAPQLLGSAAHTTGTTLTISPLLQSTGPGDNVLVGVAVSTAGVTATVTDTRGNTYTPAVSDTGNTAAQLRTFEAVGAALLAAGTDTITVTLSASSPAVVIAASNPDVASGPTGTIAAHGSTSTPNLFSAFIAEPAEQNAVAFLASTTAGGAPVWGSGFTGLTTVADGGSHLFLSVGAAQIDQANFGGGSGGTFSIFASATITTAPWAMALINEPLDLPLVTGTVPPGVAGFPYGPVTVGISGGEPPYSWVITGLPAGLTATGPVISGTPTTAGTYPVTIAATDAFGFTVPAVQTLIVNAPGPAAATVQAMPGNVLKTADAFPGTGFTWETNVNATAPVLAQPALAGGNCLEWAAPGPGPTSLIGAPFAAVPQAPYIASAVLMTDSAIGPNATIAINWYDSNGVLISTSTPAATTAFSAINAWQGVQLATVAPPDAATGALAVGADTAAAGDTTRLGVAFAARTGAQVLIDFINPAFLPGSAAGTNFTDVSPWLRQDQTITISRGRQDAISEISAGSATFSLQNDQGYFTKGNTASLIAAMGGLVTLAGRCQINIADETGTWWTRFDGPLSQVDYTLDPTGDTNLAQMQAADILGELNRQDPLSCWTREQVLQDGPLYHWALDDYSQGSAVQSAGTAAQTTGATFQTVAAQQASFLAAETSGNNGPPLKAVNHDSTPAGQQFSAGPPVVEGAATIAWGDTSGGVETLADAAAPGQPDGAEYWPAGSRLPANPCRGLDSGTVGPFTTPTAGVYLTPMWPPAAGTAQNQFAGNVGYTLGARLPAPLNPSSSPAGDFSAEAWFTLDPNVGANGTLKAGPYIVLSLGSTRGSQVITAGAYLNNSAIPEAGAAYYSSGPGFAALNFAGLAVAPAGSALAPLASGSDVVQRPHHLVLVCAGSATAPAVTVYVDNNVIGTITVPPGVTFDQIVVGGAYAGGGAHYGGVQLVSIYPYQLSLSQIAWHAQLGQYGMWETPTDDAIAQLAVYAGIPQFWNGVTANHDGLSLTDYFDITGSSAYTGMTTYEQVEAGLLFVNAAGELTFHTRDWRAGYGPAKLDLPPDSYSEQLGLEIIDTYMSNEDAVASAAFAGGASYINTASQQRYGTYATNPATSPAQLPHISWSRAYTAAGLAPIANWPDPAMSDAAAWPANSRSDPWLAPGGVVIDLLTVNPNWGFNASDIYALEIDDAITLSGGLPQSMPNASGAVDWFIEGVTETYGLTTRTVTFYGSPAATQRAWIPGDPVYGVLSATTRLGVSAADTSQVQADGKDVAHDGGPPFWPPQFTVTMNSPSGGTGFVGANDMRGLTWPLQQSLTPPMLVAATGAGTEVLASGQQSTPQVFLDTIFSDSANGMGVMPGWPNWWVCLAPGFYEINATVPWQAVTSGGGAMNMAWIVVAKAGTVQLNDGSGFTPVTNQSYVCPVGEAIRQNSQSLVTVASPVTRMYLGLGDMVTLAGAQDTGGNRTIVPGTALSIRFTALGTADDGCEFNSSINGGTVTAKPVVSGGVKTYANTHVFTYYGGNATSGTPYGLYQQDTTANQGQYVGGVANGTQYALIEFPYQQIATDLAGKTVLSATLTASCTHTNNGQAITLIGGYYYTVESTTSWNPTKQSPKPAINVFTEQFKEGQTKTWALSASSFQKYFLTNGARGFMIGDDKNTSLNYYGHFGGTPGAWALTVNYK